MWAPSGFRMRVNALKISSASASRTLTTAPITIGTNVVCWASSTAAIIWSSKIRLWRSCASVSCDAPKIAYAEQQKLSRPTSSTPTPTT